MKHLLTIIAAMLAVGMSMAQTVNNLDRLSAPPRIMLEPSQHLMLREGVGSGSTIPDFSTDAVTAQKIGSSANYLGYSNNGQKQSYLINDLNSIAFIFRNNPNVSGAGNSGHLRYNISSNRGVNWAVPSTGAGIGNLNPLQLRVARYPNCVLFTNPPIGGTTSNARIGALAAVLDNAAAGWEGFVKLVVGPNVFTNITTPLVEQEEYTLLEGPVFPQHITERVPGEFWATVFSETAGNDTLYVLKGTYDATAQSILWAYHDKLIPTWNTSVDGNAHWTMPKIEFSPDGTKGNVVVLGDLVGGQDSAYVPIIWDYNSATDHFSGGYEFDLNQFPQLQAYISSFTDSIGNPPFSPLGVATTAFNFDLTIDSKNNLHILCIIGPSSSGIPSNTAAYSISSGFGLQVMDITKDNTNSWNMIKLWDQQTFREDVSGTPLDPSMNLARTQDGKYIFYTWSDTDTTGNAGNNANNAPNLKGRFYDVVNDMISPTIDWTFDDAIWVGNAHGPKTPNRVFESGNACPGRTFNVPTTVFNSPGGADTDFFYFSNINYNCSDATLAPEWFYTCAMNPITGTPNLTSPTCNTNDGVINLALGVTGGMTPYTYELFDVLGNSLGVNNPFTNLPASFYTALVIDSFGCEKTFYIPLNSLGAPATISSNISPPPCSNDSSGTMTVCWTGGTNPISVNWYGNNSPLTGGTTTGNCNTNSSLPAGLIVATVEDANGCLSSVYTTLNSPSALNLSSSYTNLTCKDSADGSIVVSLSGCSGSFNYSWIVPIGMPNPGNTNILTGLKPGTYICIATCLATGCIVTDTFIIDEPAQYFVNPIDTIPTTVCSVPYNGTICVGTTGGNGSPGPNVVWTGVSGSQNPYTPTPDPNDPSCIINLPGGTYTVTVTDPKGCTATTTITLSGCQVGVEQYLNIHFFKAYPNPVSQLLNIEMTLPKVDNVQLSLVNLAGQTLMEQHLTNISEVKAQFKVANLAKEIYLLRVSTSDGIAAEKIIIE